MTTFALHLHVHVRRCVEEDLQPMEWFGLYWSQRELIHRAFQRQQRGEVLMLVADLAGHPIAQAWVDFAKKAEEGVAVIWALRVHPHFWGHRIAGRMIAAAEEAIADAQFPTAELAVAPDNDVARRLYVRLGYEDAGAESEETTWVRPDGIAEREVSTHLLLRKPVAPAAPAKHRRHASAH